MTGLAERLAALPAGTAVTIRFSLGGATHPMWVAGTVTARPDDRDDLLAAVDVAHVGELRLYATDLLLELDAATRATCPTGSMARPHWRHGPHGPLCGHLPDGDCGCELDLLGRLFRVLPSCPFHGGAA